EYQYAYEAVLDEQPLGLELIRNDICYELIKRMLSVKPEDRPSMSEVFEKLHELLLSMLERDRSTDSSTNSVFRPGDL
ncbi:MAG: hypothetical protein Q4B26_20560, partial [Eubacteriales bacterium]|nr:hypothetical protein [Eubacteriales bacterium]